MMNIAANDLKIQGVASIEAVLKHQLEAIITVRGQKRYVVMDIEHYEHLRECELEAAFQHVQADLAAGRYVRETAEQHIKRLRNEL